MKKNINWLQDIEINYNASKSFLKEMDLQLKAEYEKLMNHTFDLSYLFVEPIVENQLNNLNTENVKYFLECFTQKSFYSANKPSYISWRPVNEKEGLIDPQKEISNIPMIFQWESIYISPDQIGLYKIGKVNLQLFFDYVLPFETDMDELKSVNFNIFIEIYDDAKENLLLKLIETFYEEFNLRNQSNILEGFNFVGQHNLNELKFKIKGGSADLNEFLIKFITEISVFENEVKCIKKVSILNKLKKNNSIEKILEDKLLFDVEIDRLNDLDFFITIEMFDMLYIKLLCNEMIRIYEEFNDINNDNGCLHSINILDSHDASFVSFKIDGGSANIHKFKEFLLEQLSIFQSQHFSIKKLYITND